MVAAISAEIHFWRLPPERWADCLDAIGREGVGAVSSYLSWRRHAPTRDLIDLAGKTDARLDVRRFLGLCRDRGLSVHLKPGPWICAEEPAGGYPDWLLEDHEMLALDQHGEPVVGYFPPFEHHVPSYHHPVYLVHALRWLRRVSEALADEFAPRGPIVAIQLDNEPGWCFRDGPYEADYSETSIDAFRRWCQARYRTLPEVEAAWGLSVDGWDHIQPPREASPTSDGQHGEDWIAFKEWTLANHLVALSEAFADVPDRVERTYNLCPRAVPSVPSNELVLRAIGPGGPDLYYLPRLDRVQLERAAMDIAVSEMAVGDVWVPELQAGIWQMPGVDLGFDRPTPQEQLRFATACLAYGVRSLDFFMAVGRENWADAPITEHAVTGRFVAAIREVRAIIDGIPGWHEMQVDRQVAIVWDRSAARRWHLRHLRSNESRGAPVTPWFAAFRAVLAAGLTPGFWDPTDGEVPAGTRAVVLVAGADGARPSSGLPTVSLTDPRSDSAAAPTTDGPLDAFLHRLGISASSWEHDPAITTVLHHHGASRAFFVINHEESRSMALDRFRLTDPAIVTSAGSLSGDSVSLPASSVVCLFGEARGA